MLPFKIIFFFLIFDYEVSVICAIPFEANYGIEYRRSARTEFATGFFDSRAKAISLRRNKQTKTRATDLKKRLRSLLRAKRSNRNMVGQHPPRNDEEDRNDG